MFEIMIQNLESVHLIVKHHMGRATPDLDGKIGSAVPGVNLAHTGKIKTGNACPNRRDVFGMVHQGNRLGVACPE